MKHIIVHLIRGEAAEAHINITKELAEKFDSFPIHNRLPPHLTIKRPFELTEEEMQALYEKLEAFPDSHTQSDYELKGYGHFGTNVIYVDALASEELLSTVRDLKAELKAMGNMPFDEFDLAEDDLHATVAFAALKPFDYDQVWDHLNKGPIPDFKMKFDNIATLKKENDKWIIDRVWEINP